MLVSSAMWLKEIKGSFTLLQGASSILARHKKKSPSFSGEPEPHSLHAFFHCKLLLETFVTEDSVQYFWGDFDFAQRVQSHATELNVLPPSKLGLKENKSDVECERVMCCFSAK